MDSKNKENKHYDSMTAQTDHPNENYFFEEKKREK